MLLEEWRCESITEIRETYLCSKVQTYLLVTAVFFKVFEKDVYMHLSGILKRVLDENQHGFISGRSVATNLVAFLSDVAPSVS